MSCTRINKISIAGVIGCLIATTLVSCGRESSPEGRMSIKLESVQQEMYDSMKAQNAAILDSLGKIREELRALRQQLR
ncbi:hypothetical protein EXU57_09590 [Segetibacter sp. 3557_3]|uniref:hypothetical protein n=1 Tax=Segetibacter sp. 3557_3 TaxID=2547429 RepID=UPI0010585A18|nr:hypothetical protein [Segetibacter sp. 3557_3]TDH27040.1 hypothetical protein EXU57_09590 [Segetibacter sp. 3557_3]